MKQVLPVEGKTLAGFASALNEAYAELSRFEVYQTERIPGKLEALIYYEYPDDLPEPEPELFGGPEPDFTIELPDGDDCSDTVTIRFKVGKHPGRYCAECDNYDYGRSCPFRDGHVKPADEACTMFNLIIEGRF